MFAGQPGMDLATRILNLLLSGAACVVIGLVVGYVVSAID